MREEGSLSVICAQRGTYLYCNQDREEHLSVISTERGTYLLCARRGEHFCNQDREEHLSVISTERGGGGGGLSVMCMERGTFL